MDLLNHPSRLRQRLAEAEAKNDQLRAVLTAKGLHTLEEVQDMAVVALARILCPICGMLGESTGCVCACPGACIRNAKMILQTLEDAGLIIGEKRGVP